MCGFGNKSPPTENARRPGWGGKRWNWGHELRTVHDYEALSFMRICCMCRALWWSRFGCNRCKHAAVSHTNQTIEFFLHTISVRKVTKKKPALFYISKYFLQAQVKRFEADQAQAQKYDGHEKYDMVGKTSTFHTRRAGKTFQNQNVCFFLVTIVKPMGAELWTRIKNLCEGLYRKVITRIQIISTYTHLNATRKSL